MSHFDEWLSPVGRHVGLYSRFASSVQRAGAAQFAQGGAMNLAAAGWSEDIVAEGCGSFNKGSRKFLQ